MEQKGFFERIKEKFTMSLFFYLVLIATVVILTLFPVVFDLKHADWEKIISNCIISLILVLLTFSFQSITKRNNEEKDEKSELFIARKHHIAKIKEIQNLSLSRVHEIYVNEKNKELKQQYIEQVFHSYEIPIQLYDCDAELVEKAHDQHKISNEQYNIIKKMRKGDFEVDFYKLQDLTCSVILNNSKNTNKSQQSEIIASELTSKVLFILISSFLWGTLVYQATDGGIPIQSWLDLCSRLLTTISGIWAGEVCGKALINDDIRLYNKFYNFNNQFLQDFKMKIWQPDDSLINQDIIKELTEQSTEQIIEISEEEFNKIHNEE